ncbi:MAG: purine-nucleoside phosphorylase [Sulfolobales archaeon]|nr:purine-nucleoside phosphorylase [Sulfolobales archaeon]
MGKPIHMTISPETVARRAIVAGDPARVEQVKELLEDPKLVNTRRAFTTYTGTYRGVPITIAAHGVGFPSSAIVFEELSMVGAKLIVRLGTCGAMIPGVRIGDVVIPTGAAYYPGGAYYQYFREWACCPTVPSFDVVRAIVEEFEKAGIKHYIGPVISSDAFYAEDPEFVKKWTSRGVIAVEMECAGLFALGLARNVKTGAVLLVSDSLVEHLGFAKAEELREYVMRAARTLLEAVVKVKLD